MSHLYKGPHTRGNTCRYPGRIRNRLRWRFPPKNHKNKNAIALACKQWDSCVRQKQGCSSKLKKCIHTVLLGPVLTEIWLLQYQRDNSGCSFSASNSSFVTTIIGLLFVANCSTTPATLPLLLYNSTHSNISTKRMRNTKNEHTTERTHTAAGSEVSSAVDILYLSSNFVINSSGIGLPGNHMI